MCYLLLCLELSPGHRLLFIFICSALRPNFKICQVQIGFVTRGIDYRIVVSPHKDITAHSNLTD